MGVTSAPGFSFVTHGSMVSKRNRGNNNHGQSLLGLQFKEVVPPLGPRVSLSRCGCGIEMAERESNSGGDRRIWRGSLTAFMGWDVSGSSLLSFIHFSRNASLFSSSFQPRPLCHRHNSGQDETIEAIMAMHTCRNKSRILLRCNFHSERAFKTFTENGSDIMISIWLRNNFPNDVHLALYILR